MFDFLKKLFGKKQESAEQKAGTEPTAQIERQAQKSAVGSAVRPDSPMNRPGVIKEVDRRPAEQRQQPAARPVVQPPRPVVQPPKPVAQPQRQVWQQAWPPVPAKPDRTAATAASGKPAQKTASATKPQKKEDPVAKPASASTRVASQRRVVAPSALGRVQVAPVRQDQRHEVYIGLDFGTTFTKVAYQVTPSTHKRYSVKFGSGESKEDYYLPSVLYFDPRSQKLKIADDTGKSEEIRYFKYSMISTALQKNKVLNDPAVVTRTAKEPLCCVFFLSHVINLTRNAVYENFDFIKGAADISWYINMGVPLEAHEVDKRAALYKKVLEIAWLFEQKYHGIKEISIQELDEFYVEHREESNSHINILPEIYAEVLLYQQYLNTPAGFYTVVDIGGGTEDIATFLKTTDQFNEKVDCLAQKVIEYGYDSIAESIVREVTPASVEKAKKLLGKKINFNDDEILRSSAPKEVAPESLLDARLKCRTLFGKCVQEARNKKPDVLQQTVKNHQPMYVFVMGGANSVEFYKASIEHMKTVQANAGIPYFKDADVYDYIGKNIQLEIRNDQRLVISQMLAQPIEMIPEIDHMPWELKEKKIKSEALDWMDLQDKQNELYPV